MKNHPLDLGSSSTPKLERSTKHPVRPVRKAKVGKNKKVKLDGRPLVPFKMMETMLPLAMLAALRLAPLAAKTSNAQISSLLQ